MNDPLDDYRRLLPDYTIERSIASGGMGVVLQAVQKSLGRRVAVKLLRMDTLDEADLARFTREARSYATLSHPHLVRVYDADLCAEVPFMVLEYIEGSDLRSRLEAAMPPAPVGAGRDLTGALAYIHSRGILHRDIKPANILVATDGRVVLTDFGLARPIEPDRTALTQRGFVVGTPHYMAPEVLEGAAATAASDVYALALVLYEMAAGRPVFTPGCSDGVDLYRRVKEGVPALASRGISAWPGLDALIGECLAREPATRPDAGAMALRLAELAATAGGASGRGRVVGRARGETTDRFGPGPGGAATRRDRAPGRGPLAPRATAASCVVALALVGWALLREPQRRADPAPSPFPPVSKAEASPRPPQTRDGIAMVLVGGAWGTMGHRVEVYPEEGPVHRVHVRSFWIDRHEVTNVVYDRFCRETGHRPRRRYPELAPDIDRPDHPVVGVSWDDATAYCRWAGKRLPSEAEWERAARGTDGRPYPWGGRPPSVGRLANFKDLAWARRTGNYLREAWDLLASLQSEDGFAFTAPAGSLPAGASPYGVLEMAGNVSEWCQDWFDAAYYRVSPTNDPRGPPAGNERVVRGGSWYSDPFSLRCSYRGDHFAPDLVASTIGFRGAASPSAGRR